MSAASPFVWCGVAMAVAAVLQLRRAWGLPRRSTAANGAGWALMLAGATLALAGDGAWGLAIASLSAMATASLLLAHAGWTSPRGKARASARKAHVTPKSGEPRHVGRRLMTFAIAIPFAFFAALLGALGARALAGMAGVGEADGNAMALLLAPLLWGVLSFWLLMLSGRRAQWACLAIPSVTGFALILIQGAL